jgi:hypothetical protein
LTGLLFIDNIDIRYVLPFLGRGLVMTAAPMRRALTALIEAALLGAILLVAVLGVVRPLVGPAGLHLGTGSIFGRVPSVEATIDIDKVRVTTEPSLPTLGGRGEIASGDALEMLIPTQTRVAAYEPDLRQTLGLVGSGVLTALVVIAVLVCLLLLVRSLRGGDPFVPANARRLYAIAIAVGVGGEAASLLHAWGRADVLGDPAIAPFVLTDVDFTLMPLWAGLGLAVAAEVFRQGAALRQEVEGLV